MNLENNEYLREIADKGERLDQRKPVQRRAINIKRKVINHADGSAYVELGQTKVMAGVKVLEGVPYPDKPDEGSLIVSFEPTELADDYPKDRLIYGVEVGRVTDRGIRESRVIDMKKMVIEAGKKSFFVYIDIYALNNDGNLLDASNIAALAALLDAKFKRTPESEPESLPLDLQKMSFSSTFVKIGKNVFLDPMRLEENASDAKISIAVSTAVNSMQKGGVGFFTPEEVDFCIGKAFDLGGELKDLLTSSPK